MNLKINTLYKIALKKLISIIEIFGKQLMKVKMVIQLHKILKKWCKKW